MHSIEGALRMSDEINAQFGFERAFGMANGNADADTKKNLTYTLDNIPLRKKQEMQSQNQAFPEKRSF